MNMSLTDLSSLYKIYLLQNEVFTFRTIQIQLITFLSVYMETKPLRKIKSICK